MRGAAGQAIDSNLACHAGVKTSEVAYGGMTHRARLGPPPAGEPRATGRLVPHPAVFEN